MDRKILYCFVNITLFFASVYGQCSSNEDCKVIKSCPYALKILSQNPLSPQDVQRLQSSQCGYDNSINQPKVCCPKAVERSDGLLPTEDVCGKNNPNAIVLDGRTTSLGQFPWLALLQYETPNGTEFQCGGTLITNSYVLTSANCILGIPQTWKLVKVRLGEHQLNTDPDCEEGFDLIHCASSPIDVPVGSTTIHPQFRVSNANHNIALIKLSRPVQFTESIQPICLLKNQEFITNFTGIEAGFGTLDSNSRSYVKRKQHVAIVPIDLCNEFYKKFRYSVTDSLFCAGQNSITNPCMGDDGCAFMKLDQMDQRETWYLYGLRSYGKEQCNSDLPKLYTSIPKYLPWITENLTP